MKIKIGNGGVDLGDTFSNLVAHALLFTNSGSEVKQLVNNLIQSAGGEDCDEISENNHQIRL